MALVSAPQDLKNDESKPTMTPVSAPQDHKNDESKPTMAPVSAPQDLKRKLNDSKRHQLWLRFLLLHDDKKHDPPAMRHSLKRVCPERKVVSAFITEGKEHNPSAECHDIKKKSCTDEGDDEDKTSSSDEDETNWYAGDEEEDDFDDHDHDECFESLAPWCSYRPELWVRR